MAVLSKLAQQSQMRRTSRSASTSLSRDPAHGLLGESLHSKIPTSISANRDLSFGRGGWI